MLRPVIASFVLLFLVSLSADAQVTADRLRRASDEPENWLTYSGSYSSIRHSLLDQISPGNVENLKLAWVFQARSLENFTATPLVVDGVMYITIPWNRGVAIGDVLVSVGAPQDVYSPEFGC